MCSLNFAFWCISDIIEREIEKYVKKHHESDLSCFH